MASNYLEVGVIPRRIGSEIVIAQSERFERVIVDRLPYRTVLNGKHHLK